MNSVFEWEKAHTYLSTSLTTALADRDPSFPIVSTLLCRFLSPHPHPYPDTLLVQICSNGGVQVVRSFLEHSPPDLVESLLTSRLHGVAFYCAPIAFSFWELHGFMSAVIFPKFLLSPLWLPVRYLSVLLYLLFSILFLGFGGLRQKTNRLIMSLIEKTKYHVLFLYSKRDALADYRFVESFAEKVRTRLNQISENDGQTRKVRAVEMDADHVALPRSHPEQYQNEIALFLKESKII